MWTTREAAASGAATNLFAHGRRLLVRISAAKILSIALLALLASVMPNLIPDEIEASPVPPIVAFFGHVVFAAVVESMIVFAIVAVLPKRGWVHVLQGCVWGFLYTLTAGPIALVVGVDFYSDAAARMRTGGYGFWRVVAVMSAVHGLWNAILTTPLFFFE